jgi:hypothetical protein
MTALERPSVSLADIDNRIHSVSDTSLPNCKPQGTPDKRTATVNGHAQREQRTSVQPQTSQWGQPGENRAGVRYHEGISLCPSDTFPGAALRSRGARQIRLRTKIRYNTFQKIAFSLARLLESILMIDATEIGVLFPISAGVS